MVVQTQFYKHFRALHLWKLLLQLFSFTTYRQKRMSIYRSQTVQKFKIYLPRESAWNIMNNLGQHQLVHIVPSKNDQVYRTFTSQIKRIEQTLSKILTLEQVLIEKKFSHPLSSVNKEKMQQFFGLFDSLHEQNNNQSGTNQANIVIQNIDELWEVYIQISKRIEMIEKEIKNSRQNIAILLAGQKQYGRSFFSNERQRFNSYDKINSISVNKINYKAGVIKISDQLRFKRTVFRVSKGNCLIMTKKLDDLFSVLQKNESQKTVFYIIYPAHKETYFDRKLTKLIGTFCDRNFDYLSLDQASFEEIIQQQRKVLFEALGLKNMLLNELQYFLSDNLLEDVRKNNNLQAPIQKYQFLKLYLMKQKQIYINLNEMQAYNHFFQGEVFIRKQNVKKVQEILNLNSMKRQMPPGNIVPLNSHQKYPTSFVLNDFTRPAQLIVETYGVPRYKEINPSLFTNITFPFLFGVMFGDIGHGLIVLAFGIILIYKEERIKKQNASIFYLLLPYKYLITLMGFFATFCGFIYNDFLSISLNLFGSCYTVEGSIQGSAIQRLTSDCTYPIGIDPVWSVASNSLNFTNSLKMKISVIIGVLHMTLGVILRAFNDIYFRNHKEFIFVFITQITFLLLFFGYMDFLIIYKWLTPWGTERNVQFAPSIIGQMIAIPLLMGSTEGKPLWNQYSQQSLQCAILIIGAICVPLMLFPVPLMKIFQIQRKKLKNNINKFIRANTGRGLSDMENDIREVLIEKQHFNNQDKQIQFISSELSEEESPSEIFVHQIIETIEFVLGCVSNTASYLRLWALSLAHSQLSQVFFQKTVQESMESGWSGIIMNIIGFSLLASTTAGIMLLMDTMECFLHTLRLHWVEFQNKFFKGDGYSFKDYNFRNRINEELRKNNQ